MNVDTIKDNIKIIQDELTSFENLGLSDIDPCLSVKEFNDNVDKLKIKLQRTDNESVFFQNVFITDDYYENIISYLDQTQISLDYKIKKKGVSPKANKYLQQSLNFIQETIDLLLFEHSNLVKLDRDNFFKNSAKKRREIRDILAELRKLQQKIQKIIYVDSKIVANVILKDFSKLYTFFVNCVKFAKSKQDELLLVEVAAIADKMMNVIFPIFNNKSLSVDELIYYYLFFELKEIKISAIGNKID